MSRRTRIALGTLITMVGLTGMLAFWPAPAVTAQPANEVSDAHETMEAMMDAMHGPGTAERMHQVPGAEEMMDQCAAMMAGMGSGMMNGMMGSGMMGGMMGGGMMGG